jgi:hypothetical protein
LILHQHCAPSRPVLSSLCGPSAARDEDVKPAVVIIVEKRNAAADGFKDVVIVIDWAEMTGERRPAASATSLNFELNGRPDGFRSEHAAGGNTTAQCVSGGKRQMSK